MRGAKATAYPHGEAITSAIARAPSVLAGSITCETCQHFTRDPINPPAGMGTCALGHAMWHAGAPHRCTDHQSL